MLLLEDDLVGSWTRFWQSDRKDYVAITRLMILGDDLDGLRFALRDFRDAQTTLNGAFWAKDAEESWREGRRERHAELHRRMFHHARTFVVVMRRFSRLLEAATGRLREYPSEIGKAIKLSWRAAKPHLDTYRVARDAIEHIDGEITGTNHRFMNLRNDRLEVVEGIEVPISQSALDVAERAWKRIMYAVTAPAKDAARRPTRQRFLLVLQAKIDSIDVVERGAA